MFFLAEVMAYDHLAELRREADHARRVSALRDRPRRAAATRSDARSWSRPLAALSRRPAPVVGGCRPRPVA